MEEFRLMGLRLPFKTTHNEGKSSIDCGSLWQTFEKQQLFHSITQKLSNEIYAVYFDYQDNEFTYFIGCKVPINTQPTQSLEVLDIPRQVYKKFTAKGKMTACITNTWKEITSSVLNRSHTFDFEVYDERCSDWNNAEVDIYIAVK